MLDTKDKKILFELDKNSRISYTQLAKKIRLKQETTRYRVNKLIKEHTLTQFFTCYNVSALGLTIHKILLRLHNTTANKRKRILNHLASQNNIVWVADCEGAYDIAFALQTTNVLQAKKILAHISQKFSRNIQKKEIAINIQGEYLPRHYLTNTQRPPTKKISYTSGNPSQKQQKNIDKHDIRILAHLTQNARKQATDIANEMHISSDTVHNRIRRMQKNNIITRQNIVVNHTALNQTHHKLFIYLKSISPQQENTLLTFCRSIERITYIITTLGSWDLELDIEVQNIHQYRDIVTQLTSRFAHLIQDYKSAIIFNVHKYNLLPKEMAEEIIREMEVDERK